MALRYAPVLSLFSFALMLGVASARQCSVQTWHSCKDAGCCLPDELTGQEYTCYEKGDGFDRYAQCRPTGQCPEDWTCKILHGLPVAPQEPDGTVCAQDSKLCDDGVTEVFRNAQNGCDFDACPARICPQDVMLCPDNTTFVNRDPATGCVFKECPTLLCSAEGSLCSDGVTTVFRNSQNGCAFDECPASICTADVMLCPDKATYVSRNALNNCEFFQCPPSRVPLTPCSIVVPACDQACPEWDLGEVVIHADNSSVHSIAFAYEDSSSIELGEAAGDSNSFELDEGEVVVAITFTFTGTCTTGFRMQSNHGRVSIWFGSDEGAWNTIQATAVDPIVGLDVANECEDGLGVIKAGITLAQAGGEGCLPCARLLEQQRLRVRANKYAAGRHVLS